MTLFRTSRALLAVLVLFAASTASAATIKLSATIDGAQANAGAGTGSPGTGTAAMTLDTDSNLFSWNISWSGLLGDADPTIAHFHGPALPNQNAGVELGIDVSSNPSIGNAVLTTAQESDLLEGLWYINLHTQNFPGGEVRGQVGVVPLPAAAWLFGSAVLALAAFKRKKTHPMQ